MSIEKIKARVEKRSGFLWHFTERDNAASIFKRGLLSLAYCEQHGIVIPRYCSDENSRVSDRLNQRDAYVHLCFRQSHPMYEVKIRKGELQHPYWVRVSTEVLTLPGVQFCDVASNTTGSELLTAEEAEEKISWDKLFAQTSGGLSDDEYIIRKNARMAEILVPKGIATSLLVRG